MERERATVVADDLVGWSTTARDFEGEGRRGAFVAGSGADEEDEEPDALLALALVLVLEEEEAEGAGTGSTTVVVNLEGIGSPSNLLVRSMRG